MTIRCNIVNGGDYMNVSELISKIDMNSCSCETIKVHFVVGGFEVKELRDMTLTAIEPVLAGAKAECTEKGFAVQIGMHQIPGIITALSNNMVAVYAVIPEV